LAQALSIHYFPHPILGRFVVEDGLLDIAMLILIVLAALLPAAYAGFCRHI
jgi:hypothetical protein